VSSAKLCHRRAAIGKPSTWVWLTVWEESVRSVSINGGFAGDDDLRYRGSNHQFGVNGERLPHLKKQILAHVRLKAILAVIRSQFIVFVKSI